MNKFFTFSIAVAALAASAGASFAEGETAAKSNVATTTFQDWLVRCPAAPQSGPCDAVQLLIEPKSKQRVLSISVAYELGKGQHVVRIVLPLGVWLPNGVTIVDLAGSTGSPSLTAVPYATGVGSPNNSYGFIRFTTKVEP